MPVTIGVDPHKASHTAAALDEHGQLPDRKLNHALYSELQEFSVLSA